MEPHFPGSVLERRGKSAEEFLNGLFFATKGLMLAQIKEITGLDTPAIQNWVGRGWVEKPVEKRYSANHLARILIINMLREVTRLEVVAGILTYINGSAESREDDIISEPQLYCYLCDILDVIDYETILTPGGAQRLIEQRVTDYREPYPGARQKLIRGMKLILTYYAASLVKVRADEEYEELLASGQNLPALRPGDEEPEEVFEEEMLETEGEE